MKSLLQKNSVWRYCGKYWPFFLAGLLGLLMTNFSVLSMGRLLAGFVESTSLVVYASDNTHIIALIMTSLVVGSFLRSFMVNYFSEKALWDMGERIYQNILGFSADCFQKISRHEVAIRFATDMNVALPNLGTNISFAMRNIISLIGSIGMLFYSSWEMSAYVLIAVPLLSGLIYVAAKYVRIISKKQQHTLLELFKCVDENVRYLTMVQAFCQEARACEEFSKYRARNTKAARNRIIARSLFVVVMMVAVFSVIGFMAMLGNQFMDEHLISGGEITSFVFYFVLAITAFSGLVDSVGDVQRSIAACSRLYEFMDVNPSIRADKQDIRRNNENQAESIFSEELADREQLNSITHPDIAHMSYTRSDGQIPFKNKSSCITFKNVAFKYPSSKTFVLNDFSLQISAGKTLSIIGTTGSGKSTLCNLLLRFYDPMHGSISIDNINIKDIPLRDLRNIFGYVPSEPVVFNRSLRENISYGAAYASDIDIEHAIDIADIKDYVHSKGLDYILGSNDQLSSGQKQRIAIARALVKKPKILLFDEASSALDYETERTVRSNINTAVPDITKIFITHRLQILNNDDLVLVINDGRAEAFGKFGDIKNNSDTCIRLLLL